MRITSLICLVAALIGCSSKKSTEDDNTLTSSDSTVSKPGEQTTHKTIDLDAIVPTDTVQYFSQQGKIYSLIPISKKAYDQEPAVTAPPLKVLNDVMKFKTEISGEVGTFTKTYAGTFPRSGIHVYKYAGYEEGGYTLLYPKSFEAIATKSQVSAMPVESPDGQYIFQAQEEREYRYGIAVFVMKDRVVWDIAWFDSVRLAESKFKDNNHLLFKDNVNESKERYFSFTISNPPMEATLTDSRDDKRYPIVRMGRTWWMNKNLDFKTDSSKQYLSPDNILYGRFYTWAEAQNVCPKGWHLPETTNWDNVFVYWKNGWSNQFDFWAGMDGSPGDYFFKANEGVQKESKLSFDYSGASNMVYYGKRFECFGYGSFGYYWGKTERQHYMFSRISDGSVKQFYVSQYKNSDENIGYCIRCVQDVTIQLPTELPYWLTNPK